jgi:predicted permease
MSEFLRDLRFGLRLLAKSPAFTITAALLLAVGISANTLIFSLVNALLLRPLPVSHPENLVRLVEVHPNDFVTWDLPYNFCDAVASRDADFSEVICQGEADVAFDVASNDGTSTERIRIHLISPTFFSSLGVHPYMGRVLTAEDEHARAQNAVLSYDFWQRRFRGDTSVLGRKIILGGHPFSIVGVSPEGFNGLAVDTSPDIRVPAAVDRLLVKPDAGMKPAARPVFAQVFARLRSGVTFERANAELDPLVHAAYEEEFNKIYPSTEREPSIRSRLRLESIVNGVSTLRAQFSRGLEVLMAGVALLLLMACANVAGLLLARSAARAQEMGVRLALGASPGRIVRQLLTEGLLLSLLGGVAGILLTIACLPFLARGLPPIRDRGAVLQPLAMHISIDLRVLGFALGVTILTAVLFALSPALRCARADVASTLRGGRTTTRRVLTGNLIVTAQVAICTLILMGAALLVETLVRMRSMNPGFDSDRVVTFSIDPGVRGYTPDQSRVLSRTLLQKAGEVPGVGPASIALRGVMRGTGMKATLGVAGSRITPNDFLNSSMNEVTPGYFETMGMRLLAGRAFNWFDRNVATPPHRVIVNQTFARRFFPAKNPIGERFGFAGPGGVASADNQIIGVVSDAKYRSLREPIPPTVYSPVVDGFASAFILHLRTRERPETMIAPVREILHSLDPELPFIEVRTLREEVDASLWQERLLALLAATFGAIAALLASIGLYGALDYAVKSRTREIGVRMAVGAEPARIVGLFSREALLLTASGIGLGLCAYGAAAVVFTLWISKILYGLRPWEPVAVLSVMFLVALIAAIATAPAAIRAVRTDPASALRAD